MFSMFGSTKKDKEMTPQVQEKLLADPQVQALMQKAGTDALNDPKVQAQMVETCKQKFPEYATAAKDKMQEWAADPAVHAQAKELGNSALAFAGDAGNQLLGHIEQGPSGVRVLAFFASVASAANAILSLINIFSALTHVIMYMVSIYQLLFALTTVLFEAKPEWIVKAQEITTLPISKYQDMLLENAKFLSLVGGRGLFYIFQGTLWLAMASFTDLLNLASGLFLIFIGVIHVLMYFGIAPKHVSDKLRAGYSAVITPA